MYEFIDEYHLKNIEIVLKKWNDACHEALEHNTPENNHKADVYAGIVAGYVRPLFDTLQAIRDKSDIGRLFEGSDELNEDTHAENEMVLTDAMDTINKIARGVFEDE